MPQASSLEAELQAKLGADVTLIRGSNGVFDVVADGALVFSKKDAGRFPTNDEIVEALES